jgi:glycosyltransferase involved in cell wall biosynthesis
MGQQHDVLPYLRAMDAVLLTSLREQMPMTILEAMSVGLPIVATNVGEIPRMVEDTKEGLIKDLNTSPEDFALSLLTLKDFATRRRMGKAARHKIVTAFPEEVMVQKYRDVIDGTDLARLL